MQVPAAAQVKTHNYNPSAIRGDINDVMNVMFDNEISPDFYQGFVNMHIFNADYIRGPFQQTAIGEMRVKYHAAATEQQQIIRDLFQETIYSLTEKELPKDVKERLDKLRELKEPPTDAMFMSVGDAMERAHQLGIDDVLNVPSPLQLMSQRISGPLADRIIGINIPTPLQVMEMEKSLNNQSPTSDTQKSK